MAYTSKKSAKFFKKVAAQPAPHDARPLALRCRSNGGGLQAKQAPDMGFLKEEKGALLRLLDRGSTEQSPNAGASGRLTCSTNRQSRA